MCSCALSLKNGQISWLKKIPLSIGPARQGFLYDLDMKDNIEFNIRDWSELCHLLLVVEWGRLTFNWFKADFRACCPKFATGLNIRFTNIFSNFFTNYMNIFHKTEVQTVILRCWTSFKLNCFKSCETNAKARKNAKNITQMSRFFF